MKELLRTTLTLATLAASIPCQLREATPKERLDYARVVEKSEGRLDHAEQLYRGLLTDQRAKGVHAAVAYELGRLLWTLDKRDEARPFLQIAVQAGGDPGEQANRLLQSDTAEARQGVELEEKAEALVTRMNEILQRYKRDEKLARDDENRLSSLRVELLWLGSHAAKVIAGHVTLHDSITREEARLQTLKPRFSYLYNVLWELGTDPARAHLMRVAETGPLPLLRFVSNEATGKGRGLVDVWAAFAQAKDPTGEVWRNLSHRVYELDVQDVLALTGKPQPAAQALGLLAAARNWHRYNVAEREVFFSMHHHALKVTLGSSHARFELAARELLGAMLAHGPKAGTELFFEVAHAFGDQTRIHYNANRPQRVKADDAWIGGAAATAKQLGRLPPTPAGSSPSNAKAALAFLLKNMEVAWTKAAVDDLVTLFELGYIYPQGQWQLDLLANADAAQVARVIRALPHLQQANPVLRALAERDQDPSWFDAYRETAQRCFEDDSIRWRGSVSSGQIYWSGDLFELIKLAAQASPDRAVPWISRLLGERALLRDSCADLLVGMSAEGTVSSRAALRDALRMHVDHLDRRAFERVFAELVRAGDEASIPLLAEHYGHRWHDDSKPTVTRGNHRPIKISRLVENLARNDVGFDEQAQLRLWQALVTGPCADAVWYDLRMGGKRKGVVVPVTGLPSLSYLLSKDQFGEFDAHTRRASELLVAFARLTTEDLERIEQRAGLEQLLRSDRPRLVLTTFGNLRPDVAARYRDLAERTLRANPQLGDLTKLCTRIDIDADLWRLLFEKHTWGALHAIPDQRVAEFEGDIARLLTDENSSVRTEACNALVRGLGSRAAPYLLPRLRDDDQYVRKAVKKQLDELRAIRQQEDFWGDASKRIDTTPASAAARLIAQAMAEQPKQQRLLAIRSLALLGEPAALPYLIDWTNDKDQDVQKAARAAITEMHGAGKTAENGKK